MSRIGIRANITQPDAKCMNCKYFKTCWDGEMSDRLALDKAIEIVERGGRDEE